MLVLVLVGFAPTFLLREAFGRAPLPIHLVLHGAILTLWYALVAVQSTLVIHARYGWHRRLGWAGAILGIGVFASGAYSTLVLTDQFARGVTHSAKEVAEFNFLMAASYGAILPFAVFLALAVVRRKQRELHSRFMLLATMSLLGPAVSRIAAWFGELPNPASALILAVPVALCLRDLLTERRVHVVTILGIVSVFAATVLLNVVKVGEVLVRLYR